MAAVDVEALTITYGKVTAVDDVSFRAAAGAVTCMLGPNGAGKTSTIEALEGLRRPASGRLSVLGLDPRADHAALTARMGVMLQDGGIHPAVTVRAALRHAAALYGNPLDRAELVERLGLGHLEGRTYRQLSGGEQRRVALALALIGRPQVAFLDEPTSGVDPAGRQVIRQVVADLRNDGVTVLLTTHDLDESERIADRVVIMDRGRILADGTVAELTRAPDGESRVRFRAPVGLDRVALSIHLGGADVTEVAPGEYAVAAPPDPRTVAEITAWLAEQDLPLADLRAGRQRLEDVYLRLTGSPEASADAAERHRASTRAEAAAPGAEPTGEPDRDADTADADSDRSDDPSTAPPDPDAGAPDPTPGLDPDSGADHPDAAEADPDAEMWSRTPRPDDDSFWAALAGSRDDTPRPTRAAADDDEERP
jgi:ABC-2 type transport system ATP-binding protein